METKKYRLKEVLKIGNGKDHSSLGEGIIPVYGSGGFMRNVDSFLYDGESVLLPRKGSLSNIQYVRGKFWTVDTCYYTKIDNTIVDPYFLFILLKSLDLSGFDSGASIPSMTSKTYYRLKVDIPNIETQKKIALYIKKYDSLIELNTKRIKTLEQMAENLYKEWFVRFRFPGHENAEFENGIPKGWEVLRIKELSSLKSGYAFKSEWFTDEGYCVAKIKDIGSVIMDTNDLSFVEEKNCTKARKFILNEGDLTIALTGATIGKISIVPKFDVPIYTNQRLGKFFNGNNPIDRLPFLYCFFSQKEITQTILNISNASSAQPNISPEQIENIKFIGNKRLIDIFNEQTKLMFKQILVLHYKNDSLIKQRDLLLPRLMSGKLEV